MKQALRNQNLSASYVANDGQLSERLKNLEPHTDVLAAVRHGSARLAHELVCVQANLNPVIEQGK